MRADRAIALRDVPLQRAVEVVAKALQNPRIRDFSAWVYAGLRDRYEFVQRDSAGERVRQDVENMRAEREALNAELEKSRAVPREQRRAAFAKLPWYGLVVKS